MDLKGVLSVTDQPGFSTVTPFITKLYKIGYLSSPHISSCSHGSCQLEQLKSPWHGKKTWGAQWFVQSSQGCQSNGFDGSPFHTSPWCTTPSKKIFDLWWRNASLPHSLQHWKQMLCRKDLGHRGLLCLPSFPQEQFSWKLIWNWETGEDMELEINWKGFETGLAVPSRPLASAHKPSPAICRYLETYLEQTTCFYCLFLAVQDSSIGDNVSQSVSQSLSQSDFWFQRLQSTTELW